MKPFAVGNMAFNPEKELARLYGSRPTLSREGAFHRFVEAAKENLPEQREIHSHGGDSVPI